VWRSSLLAQPPQAVSYNSRMCVETVPCPFGGRRGGSFVASPSDGPTSSSWTEWNRPSINPAGSIMNSVKGFTRCTKISPHSVSWFKLLASWILPCVPSTTLSPKIQLLFTLQWILARKQPGTVQFCTTCTPLTKGRPNLSTQERSRPDIAIADLLKSM